MAIYSINYIFKNQFNCNFKPHLHLWSYLCRYLQNPIPNKMNNKLLIIVLLASITFGLSLTAFTTKKKADKGIEFYEGNFNDALAKAKYENKIIFMDAYASWCGPCKKMAANVFTDEKAGEYFNANFVNLKMDMEKGKGLKLLENIQFNIIQLCSLLIQKEM